MILVKTNKLTKAFSGNYAVNEADIVLESGKIYGLLGPNGSGKSTLMKMIAGLFHPKSGSIEVLDMPLSISAKNHVAFMSTEQTFYRYMNIEQVGNFYHDFHEDFKADRYRELIDFMNLDMNMKIKSLSSGMAAKLKVAVSMSRQAKVYMLDEPLNGIDLLSREQILKAIIGELNGENTILLSSHLVDAVENILDSVILIKNGYIALQCTAEEIRENEGISIVDKYREVFANA